MVPWDQARFIINRKIALITNRQEERKAWGWKSPLRSSSKLRPVLSLQLNRLQHNSRRKKSLSKNLQRAEDPQRKKQTSAADLLVRKAATFLSKDSQMSWSKKRALHFLSTSMASNQSIRFPQLPLLVEVGPWRILFTMTTCTTRPWASSLTPRFRLNQSKR